MSNRFAALENRANRAVFSHLSNVNATLAGLPVRGIFDARYETMGAFGEVMTASPAITLASASLPANVVGAAVVISEGPGVGNWRVAQHEPDGTGVSALRLERV